MSDPSPSASPTRRTVLVAGGLVAGGALAGIGAGLATRHGSDSVAPPDPAVLLAAVRAERILLADVEAALRGRSVPSAVVQQLHADHAAHLTALTAAVTMASGAAASTPATGASRPVPTRAQLRAAEVSAASAAAQRALAMTGRNAVLLASIAACEASHAELLA